ncbi:MAG: hypothetical protein LLG20_27325 [Acidobacteriales bacterium]|nr:hypothetical protein [Terriglobales bacterium]
MPSMFDSAPASSPQPREVGNRKLLMMDRSLVESSRGVAFNLNPAYQPQESLLPQDRPWERVRAGAYVSMAEYGGQYHMWYTAYPGVADPPSEETGPRFECYAVSSDGIRWEKPELELIEYNGSKANNIVRVYSIGSVFVDPFDAPSRRFKSVHYQAPRQYDGWPVTRKVKGGNIYLGYSPDGIRWDVEPEPVLPFYTGAPTSTVWDEAMGKWILYLRVNPKGHANDPWKTHMAFARLEIARDALAKPYPFTAEPTKKRNQFDSYAAPTDEFPPVFATDDLDPDQQVYTLNAFRYPESDYYIAFPNMWYPSTSDCDDVQFACSRDGVHWERPSRQPVIRLGLPGSGSQGYVTSAEGGLIRRGDELWLYYTGLPERHLSPNVNWESVNARAIFRVDGFVSADADHLGGELATVPLIFRGRFLELNVDASAGGAVQVEMRDAAGQPLRGFALEDCDRLRGNSTRLRVSWGGNPDLRRLAGSPVRLRIAMRSARLYSFRFV